MTRVLRASPPAFHALPPVLRFSVLVVLSGLCGCEPSPQEQAPDSTERLSLSPQFDALGLPPLDAYGISLVDFDDDGLSDISLVATEGLFLFHNEGDWVFRSVTAEFGLGNGDGANLLNAHSVIWVDIDDDGDLDLFVGRRVLPEDSGPGIDALKTPTLLRNDAGTLVDITESSGLDLSGAWEGAAFSDFTGDGVLDLILLGGVDASGQGSGSLGHEGSPGAMWRGTGDGNFELIAAADACTGPEDSESWGVLALDLDEDGDQDLLQANDFREATLCLGRAGNGFDNGDELVPLLGGPMGMGAGDLNGDGCVDIYITNFDNPDNVLSFDPDLGFTDHYLAMVADGGDPSPPYSGYGLSLNDMDLDGDQDVLWVAAYDTGAGGSAPGTLALARAAESAAGRRLFYASLGDDPTFSGSHNGYGLAHGDLDGDGDLDFGVAVDRSPRDEFGSPLAPPADMVDRSFLLRNDTARDGRGWLSVTLQQEAPNRRAVGATVRVKAQGRVTARVVTAGSSFLSSHAYAQHFGLGLSERPDWVHVLWPGGSEQIFTDVDSGASTLVRSDESCVPAGSCGGIIIPCSGHD